MKQTRLPFLIILAVGLVLWPAPRTELAARQLLRTAIQIGKDDLAGAVTSSKGSEAGVWVIAETTDLPTRYIKTVVTDEEGRYLIPNLPSGHYKIWARGYGLVDSTPVQTMPGKIVNLPAVVAPNARAAAEYYPAIYWFSLLKVPEKSDFPGTGPKGNGISPSIKSQGDWIAHIGLNGCLICHQIGDRATREIPKNLGLFDSSSAAWARRIQSGQVGGAMTNLITQFGRERAEALFADWSDRIKAGEYPAQIPPRPQGIERNIVITQWDWANPKGYLHAAIATDKRNPSVNSNGLLYGVMEDSANTLAVLDPVRNAASGVNVPIRDPQTPPFLPGVTLKPLRPSPYWGEEAIWSGQTTAHNIAMDQKGRIWLTSRIRPLDNPAFCKEGSGHPSAKLSPLTSSVRHLSVYDPKSNQFKLIDTCFPTHHLNFAEDVNNTLWISGGGEGGSHSQFVGWLNTKMFDETGDAEKAQGWTALILDTNANGKRDDYVEPDQPIDPSKDKRIAATFYGIAANPADGSIWGTITGAFPGAIGRLNPGSNPPETSLAEIYEPPWNNPKTPVQGYGPRGLDVDRNGVVWTGLASGHLASFDRRKCKGPLNGPKATGQHCPEGWTLYQLPGPQFKNVTDPGSAEAPYNVWVDQFNTLGLGMNVPIATGNENEALLALLPQTGKFVILRLPYPMGFFIKDLDGRIDNPADGWKGKGLWATWGTRTPFHGEGGKGNSAKVVHFQLRDNPLAR